MVFADDPHRDPSNDGKGAAICWRVDIRLEDIGGQ
jgi:hypothetical protein